MGMYELLNRILWDFSVQLVAELEGKYPDIDIRTEVHRHHHSFLSRVVVTGQEIINKKESQETATVEFKDPKNPTNEEINKFLETYERNGEE